MITKLTVRSFKSLDSVEVELGQVNVFIGANGSGKSNLLEALGVLSAAADGKVNDQTLLQRGVRPGVPALYKASFRKGVGAGKTTAQHISFTASSNRAHYAVSLHNPLRNPQPAWRFKHEFWERDNERLAGRSPNLRDKPNPEQGLAALRAVEYPPDDPGVVLLKTLQNYVIFTPTTAVLRGIFPEPQPRSPLGLSGGQLPDALKWLKEKAASDNSFENRVFEEALSLITWASWVSPASATALPLSPSAAASPRVIRFVDRYMASNRNELSGYDASEGALYVLFLAILAAHELSPQLCAVDNADHGLNPKLAKSLMRHLCGWYLEAPRARQVLLTTHNPLVLDGLTLQDDRVRLFTVSRTATGRTSVKRILVDDALIAKAREGWTLSRLWVMNHLGGLGDV